MTKLDFLDLIKLSFEKEVLKKLVFSRPKTGEINKISCRLVAHRGRRMLAMEYFLPGDTVSHKNLTEDELSTLAELIDGYKQINLITTSGDAELKCSKGGKETIIGGENLKRKLQGDAPAFESAIEALDKKKNYILSGDEEFLVRLGISARDGRVHDKKQGKFRQINRFLEHIEDIYSLLPKEGVIRIFDLCCGKSYLSFAVYHYLTAVKGRDVYLYGADLKRDVILWCEALAKELRYEGMHFEVGDITKILPEEKPDMVISLHACDIATDFVLNKATQWQADVILSTPCCHHAMAPMLCAPELAFITEHSMLRQKLCDAATDALRLKILEAHGYKTAALELIDPEETPKNILLRGIRKKNLDPAAMQAAREEVERIRAFLLGDAKPWWADVDSYTKG